MDYSLSPLSIIMGIFWVDAWGRGQIALNLECVKPSGDESWRVRNAVAGWLHVSQRTDVIASRGQTWGLNRNRGKNKRINNRPCVFWRKGARSHGKNLWIDPPYCFTSESSETTDWPAKDFRNENETWNIILFLRIIQTTQNSFYMQSRQSILCE